MTTFTKPKISRVPHCTVSHLNNEAGAPAPNGENTGPLIQTRSMLIQLSMAAPPPINAESRLPDAWRQRVGLRLSMGGHSTFQSFMSWAPKASTALLIAL